MSISAEDSDTFSRLFRMIRELLLNPESREQRDIVDKLMLKNGPLVSFFLQEGNEKQFRELTAKLSLEQRFRLRDHYLSLLHHIGAGLYYSETFMLSTTESFTKACNFAFSGKMALSSAQTQDAVVIMGWVPEGLGNVVKALRSDDFCPGSPIFAMLGYLHWEEGEEVFEVNPVLFDVDERWDGRELPIDQSSWEERIQATELGAYFQIHNDRLFSQQEVVRKD